MIRIRIKEWHRTIILVMLLTIAVCLIYWSRHNTDVNFIDTL
jgi:hypothetical protein